MLMHKSKIIIVMHNLQCDGQVINIVISTLYLHNQNLRNVSVA